VTRQWFTGIVSSRDKTGTVDTRVANPARVYDYWLGGKDNFTADRELAQEVIAVNPPARK
jgi:hypothetical protein